MRRIAMNITRRHSLATLAVLAIAAGLPASAVAGGSYQGNQGHKHRRPASDQINPGVCIPGEPDFDPVQCHKDITSNAPKPN
jgi:hypothetical protein